MTSKQNLQQNPSYSFSDLFQSQKTADRQFSRGLPGKESIHRQATEVSTRHSHWTSKTMPDSSCHFSQSSQRMFYFNLLQNFLFAFSSHHLWDLNFQKHFIPHKVSMNFSADLGRHKTRQRVSHICQDYPEETNEVFIDQNVPAYNQRAQHTMVSPESKPSQEVPVLPHCNLLSTAPSLYASALYQAKNSSRLLK